MLYRDSGKEKWKLLLDGTGPLLQLLHLWGNKLPAQSAAEADVKRVLERSVKVADCK